MIAYAQAREIVDAAERPRWHTADGTFFVSARGFETPDVFVIEWGAREWIVDRDPAAFLIIPGSCTTVDKLSGVVTHALGIESFEIMDTMTLVGGTEVL